MDKTSETQWHGMKQEEITQNAAHIPQRPSEFYAADFDATVYASVKFSGNYGANFCGEYQEFTRYQLLKIKRIKSLGQHSGFAGIQSPTMMFKGM